MQYLKKGDVFRMFELTGEPVMHNDKAEMTALCDSYERYWTDVDEDRWTTEV